mgnify:CR=1 FL=1
MARKTHAKSITQRNEHAAALGHRAGNAGAAVAVDTRPKTIPNKRRKNDRKRVKATLSRAAFA